MTLPSLVLLAVLAAPREEVRLAESAHYQLLLAPPCGEGEEYLRLAEALYAELDRHFGAHPPDGEKLRVGLWPDFSSYQRGGLADGIPLEALAAGGLYWTGTRRAYLWRQPSANFTRHLFLHELTHQFQFLAVMQNQARAPGWYTEGLAEHFGYHRWDGARLESGVEDVLGLEEDIPHLAEQGRAGSYDLARVVDDRAGADKPPSWAALHYLLAGPDAGLRQRFRALEPRLWAGELSGTALGDALFVEGREQANADACRWLCGLRTTWKIEWIHWDARGAELVGESTVVALVRTRASWSAASFVEATLREQSGSAGLVLGFRSTGDFLAIYRRPSGRLELVRRVPDGWRALAWSDGPAGTSVRLRAELDARGRVRVLHEGRELLSHELGAGAVGGSVGLFTDAGSTRFADVRLPDEPGR